MVEKNVDQGWSLERRYGARWIHHKSSTLGVPEVHLHPVHILTTTAMSSNFQSLAEKGGRSGSSTPADIRIRQFRDEDADAVRELFVRGLCYGGTHFPLCLSLFSVVSSSLLADISTREVGMKSIFSEPISLPAYPLLVLGLGLTMLAQCNTMRFLGGLLSLLSVTWVGFWRWRLSQSLFDYCQRSLADDLADIGGYYKIRNDKEGKQMWDDDGGVSNYWVAEAAKGDGSTVIVGCVAIGVYPFFLATVTPAEPSPSDSRTQKDKSHTELRHMSIHSDYRGKGIASLLLGTLISHAKEKGVKRILLSTTTWQANARAMYERYGWVDRWQEPVQWYVRKAKVHYMENDL